MQGAEPAFQKRQINEKQAQNDKQASGRVNHQSPLFVKAFGILGRAVVPERQPHVDRYESGKKRNAQNQFDSVADEKNTEKQAEGRANQTKPYT